MLRRTTRRAVGALLGMLTIHLTVTPVAAESAAVNRAERERTAQGEFTVVTYDSKGIPQTSVSSPELLKSLAALSPRRATQEQRKQADSLKKILVRVKNESAKNKRSLRVDNLITALDATTATDDSSYRAAIKKLHVKIVRNEETLRSGQRRTRTTYWHEGHVGLNIVYTTPLPSREPDHDRDKVGGPSASETFTPTPGQCEWYDSYENYQYQGECASQQDIDDAAATVAAVQSDIHSLESTVYSEASGGGGMCDEGYELDADFNCVQVWETSPTTTLVHNVAARSVRTFASDATQAPVVKRGGPFAEGPTLNPMPTPPCASHAILWLGALGGACLMVEKAASVLGAAAPPVGAVVAAVGGVVVMGAALGIAAAGLVDCLRAH